MDFDDILILTSTYQGFIYWSQFYLLSNVKILFSYLTISSRQIILRQNLSILHHFIILKIFVIYQISIVLFYDILVLQHPQIDHNQEDIVLYWFH